tara:strand:+ start:9006 stop:9290 length:285 start_codon:yes stop_codon:yes gene_type:complete
MPRSKKDNVKVDYNKHTNKQQKRKHNKKVRKTGKEEIGSEEDEEGSMNTKLTQFISAISDKNYASAHKYLKSAVETKLVNRVNGATEQPLFKND